MAEPYVKALPQVDAIQAPTADATKAQPEPDKPDTNSHEDNMNDEQIQAIIAQTTKAAIDAYEAKLAAAPTTNPAGVLTQPATVKAAPEAFKSFGEQLDAIRRASTPGYSMDRRLSEMKAISLSLIHISEPTRPY